MKEVMLSIKLPSELRESFKEKCDNNLQSQSEVLRKLMQEYILQGMNIFKGEK